LGLFSQPIPDTSWEAECIVDILKKVDNAHLVRNLFIELLAEFSRLDTLNYTTDNISSSTFAQIITLL